jgi:hypothetical protein
MFWNNGEKLPFHLWLEHLLMRSRIFNSMSICNKISLKRWLSLSFQSTAFKNGPNGRYGPKRWLFSRQCPLTATILTIIFGLRCRSVTFFLLGIGNRIFILYLHQYKYTFGSVQDSISHLPNSLSFVNDSRSPV